jgi:1-deoxy-D-xylulose-5-phosphate synthase
MIWEELGFTYLGPFDGHHIAELEAALVQAQNCPKKGPVFFHIITQKGKGYPEAESNVVAFHGISGSNGGSSSTPTYSEIFRQTVLKLMKENPKVVAITAAMLDGTGLSVVAKEFPQRVFDVGICEQHAVTFAAGLATQGFIPIVAVYSTFLQRAFDQIAHDVCIQKLPVIFAIDRSGIVGEDGKTHQGEFDLSYLCCLPDMIVSAPKDENELQHLLYTAVKVSQPMAIRYPRGSGPGATLEPKWHQIPIGNGELLREGKDVAILTLGSMVHPSLEAAEQLGKIGLECSVINARFAKPLDTELILGTIKNIPYVITVEENTVIGGFGSSVRQLIQESQLMPQGIKCLGIPDVFVEHGSAELLRSIYGLDAPGIARQIVDLVQANTPSYQPR